MNHFLCMCLIRMPLWNCRDVLTDLRTKPRPSYFMRAYSWKTPEYSVLIYEINNQED